MQHCAAVDAKNEWKRGVVGFLVKLRGIVTAVVLELGVSIAAFVWVNWAIGIAVLATGGILIAWVLTVRHYSLQRLESDISLHSFFHKSRDDVAKLPTQDDPSYRHCLDEFHRNSAQRMAKFFRERTGNSGVNCAIRLARMEDGREGYATVARSDGMHDNREENTKPIPSDQGLALALRQQSQQGVFIIKDVSKEVGGPLWFGTKNDSLPDVRALMAAPINGWQDGTKAMIGILYVTSDKDIFEAGDTLTLKAFADYLGLIYPFITLRQGACE